VKCKWCNNEAVDHDHEGGYKGYCGKDCKNLYMDFKNGIDLMKLQEKPQLDAEQWERFKKLEALSITGRYPEWETELKDVIRPK